ncbi:hypothetical protein Poly24_01340 [Rosistilla carotiformis]|uniref:HEAT repeat protein n=2 Tax=Rosistilla carotiformis TaxID=2528017 RepID=A0A518JLN4_9BACT|nr:hypothetical protein Poly24_01340 [Rosistilla carotiformis]
MNPSEIMSTIERLASPDGVVREKARHALIDAKSDEVMLALIAKLDDRRHQVRWEAAKALSEIGDSSASSPLVHAMDDSDSDVAWVAAEGVAGMGEVGLSAVLGGLIRSSRSGEFHRAAHHALKEFSRRGIRRDVVKFVMNALEGAAPKLSGPVATYKAMQQMDVPRLAP